MKRFRVCTVLLGLGLISAFSTTLTAQTARSTAGSGPKSAVAATSIQTPSAQPMTNSISANPVLPMLYQSLEAFDTTKHRSLGLPAQVTNFQFAREANVVPVVASEVSMALRHFALIFMMPEGAIAPTLVALVGAGDGNNQFVNKDGTWRAGAYVPAWVRRYPFFSADDGKGAQLLAIDSKAEVFKTPGAVPLLDKDGQPTDLLKSIVKFQNEYTALFQKTQAMSQALYEAKVLEPAMLNLRLPGQAAPKRLEGFLAVNEVKLRELAPDALEKLRQADALGLAYAQLFSMPSIQTLVPAP